MDSGLKTNDKILLCLGNICLSPLLGIILWFVWKEDKPRKAADACTITIFSVIFWPLLMLLFAIVGGGR